MPDMQGYLLTSNKQKMNVVAFKHNVYGQQNYISEMDLL